MSEEEVAQSGSNKKFVIIIAVLCVVIIGGGIGAVLAMSGSGDAGEVDENGEVSEEDDGQAGLPGAVLPMEPFIVNLQVKGSFLKANVQLQFFESVLPTTVESQVPVLRDTIIRILSSKTAGEILSAEGKDTLREEIREATNEVLVNGEIDEVYFTEFIVQ